MRRQRTVQVLLAALLCLLHQAESNKPPRFVNFESNLMIKEDTPVGHTIGTLIAEDEDDDVLEFSIRSEVVMDILVLVKKGPKSVDMILKNKVDIERVAMYTTLLEVTDGVNPIQKYTNIYILDVNDNAPAFISLPYRAEIPEDSTLGSFVYQVSSTDPDSGTWGLVSYNITTRQGLFTIDTANGVVTLSDQLDFETEKFYQLELIAEDGGGLNSTTDLNVNVLDVQDTPPFFLNLPYRASVYENATVGDLVLKVSAMDGDRGVPNELNFTFSGAEFDFFGIDPNTGQVSIVKPMNREDPKVLEKSGVIEMTILTQEVTSTPKGPTTAEALMTIRIIDINDQSPTFNSAHYTATVLENTQARIPVTLLPFGTEMVVADWDQGDNGRLELLLEKDGQPFDVFEVFPNKILNEGNALIRVKNSSALDFESVQEFTFDVIAREYLTPERRESRVTVTIALEDVDDNWPEFSHSVYKVELPENSPKGTSVSNFTATDKDSGLFGELVYSIGGRSAAHFSVDPQSGLVTVAVDADQDLTLLDRETLDTHSLTFQVKDGGGLQTTVQLEITLSDVNDNPPDIARSQYEGYISENEPKLERELTIEAVDIDLAPNNDVEFTITDGDPQGKFTIGKTSGVIGVTAPLDYEAMDPALSGVYTLSVTATDKGSPPHSSSATVSITVQDENDERPEFEKVLYTAILSENSTGGTDVTTVFATDDDGTAPNNEIIYRIESGAKDKFRIDAGTGKIRVESGADLDRDLYGSEYKLAVLAIDRGTPSNTGTTSVSIAITDVNNKPPAFSPAQKAVKILENAPVGREVYTYTAADPDESALLRYSLLDGEVEGEDEDGAPVPDKAYLRGLFRVHSNNGSVFVSSALNREVSEEITITLLVEDLNAEQPPIQNTTARLTITLEDVNDNPPEFTPSSAYYARVSEASQPGVEVTRVVAVDRDSSSGAVSYHIAHDTTESRSFEITEANRASGIITLEGGVDHENTAWINVTVEAVDSGTPPLKSFATVHIEIEDVNDNSPEWQVFETSVRVLENTTLDTNITQVYATDADSGEFGRVMYFITNADPDNQFEINRETGLLMTSGTLDREEMATFSITIEARDNNAAPETQQRKNPNYMSIVLIDVNDNAPEFEKARYVAEVQENARVNQRVVTVRATDKDEGVNAMVTYSVDTTQGNASSILDVNPGNGEVFVKRPLQGNIGHFTLVVVATDMGSPPLSNTTVLVVFVEDVNDHKPVVVRPPENTTIYIMENVPLGYWVTQVFADDKDVGTNGIVQYEMIETPNNMDWKKFSISQKEGNITTNEHIDREQQETYYIEVRAYDLGTPSYDDRRTLTIAALDEDDNPPNFDRGDYPVPHHVRVEEERQNVFVANVNLAKDPDSGNNSLICYYLVGGDNPWKSHFRLVKMTGDLWLDESIDREVVTAVSLVIKASEDCWTGTWNRPENHNIAWNRSDTTLLLVEVKVIDINDNPPRFKKTWFTAGVTKDTQFEEKVLDLTEYAHDPDEGENAKMNFYIVPPFRISTDLAKRLQGRKEDTPFTLGDSDGIVRTNIYFQSDMQGYIDFEMKVQDGNPAHMDRSNVSIYLLNEEQRVKVIIRGDTNYVGTFKDLFAVFLSNITGAIINVDKIMTHQDTDGKPDIRKTDMFIHGIDAKTGAVLDAQVLIDLIDKNYIHLVNLFNQYNVIEIQPAVTVVSSGPIETDLQLALILVAVVLAVLIVIVTATFIFCRRKYKRKLKAANAMAFENSPQPAVIGTRENGLNKLEMPGTNLHSYEGSNPIWMEQYENGWPRDSDTERSNPGCSNRVIYQNLSKNSMDENNIVPGSPHRQVNGLDVQELSMDMYNDEFDHYNRIPASKQKRDADAFLKAALQEHEARRPNGIPKHTSTNGHPRPKVNGGPSNSNGQIGHHRSVYDNGGFRPDQLQATEI